MSEAQLGPVRLGYERHGADGDPTVLVHGSLEDRHAFDRVAPLLAQSLSILTYDRRGYGESRGPWSDARVRADAGDLGELLVAEDFYPAHLIAHSYAGAVALRLAHERPELVRSVALHEPPFIGLLRGTPDTAAEAERLDRLVTEVRRLVGAGQRADAAQALVGAFSVDPDAWSRLGASGQRRVAERVDQWADEFADPEAALPSESAVRELLVPALVTVGDRSPNFVHRIAERLEALLRNGTFETMRGTGHSPQSTQPEQYAGLLVNFLLERNVPST